MKKIRFSGTAKYAVGIAVAVVAGGAFASAAFASIPESNGTINACYSKKDGSVKVIDPQAGGACTNKENPLSWSSGGSGMPQLLDANGQDLGTLVDFRTTDTSAGFAYHVYNSALNRIISIADSPDANGDLTFSFGDVNMSIAFQSNDCTGQAYVGPASNVKTDFYTWPSGSTAMYGIVSDSATTTNITNGSTYEAGLGGCFPASGGPVAGDYYPLTTVSLPYTDPVGPVKLQQ